MFTHQKHRFRGDAANPVNPGPLDIKNQLRAIRKQKCFEVLASFNTFWYQKLTQEKRTELENWYNAWLDVTETLIIPKTPDWITKSVDEGEEEIW